MKKSIFLAALASIICIASYGQTIVEKTESASTVMTDNQLETEQTTITTTKHYREVRTNPFCKNWEVAVGAGAQLFFGDNDRFGNQWEAIAPAIDLEFIKWGSPSVGFLIGITGLQMKGYNHTDKAGNEVGYYLTHEEISDYTGTVPPYFRQRGYFFNPYLGLRVNLCNAIAGYKENRLYNAEVMIGGGFALGFDKDFNHWGATFQAGIINRFRITKMVDLMINIRGNLISDDFDGECALVENTLTNKQLNRGLDGIGGATFGAIIKFPYDTKKKPQPKWWLPAIDEQVVTEYQKTISDLEEDVKVAKAEAAEAKAERDKIIANPPAPVVIEKNTDAPFWFHINFIIDRYDLLKRERINLHSVADLIKAHPNSKYYVIGYCDVQTATAPYNWVLSENRSNAVANYLVDHCGVNRDQLILDHKGGVDFMFFDQPEYSRCVMIFAEELGKDFKKDIKK